MLVPTFSILILLRLAFASRIYENTITDHRTTNLPKEEILVNPGVYWSVLNSPQNDITGGITVYDGGALYISEQYKSYLGLSITLPNYNSGKIINQGTIVWDNSKLSYNPDINIVVKTFTNTGLFFIATNGVTVTKKGTQFIVDGIEWTNSGQMALYLRDNKETVSLQVGYKGGSMTNTGLMCFRNANFAHTTKVLGNGWMVADDGGSLNLNSYLQFSNSVWLAGD